MMTQDNTRQKNIPQNRTGAETDESLSLEKAQMKRASKVGS